MKDETRLKYNKLTEIISSKKSLAIAYSGGTDSSLLAAVAVDILGDKAIGIFLNSPLVSEREYKDALKTAKKLRLKLEVADFNPFSSEGFDDNSKSRCYLCKSGIAKKIKEIAKTHEITDIADGLNYSDLFEYRPGIKACDEEGILHPFVEANITKDDIHEIARELKFSFADKPSSACLASRIPYGDKITPEKLKMVEEAEDILFDLGFENFRVRVHKYIARIEILPGDFEEFLKNRNLIIEKFKIIGFAYICLDIEGFRSGSLDEV
ncbi:MAG: ATP-dependent sacrificial sulfur transferase LarE [Methanomicrobium sp.]|nr:ATP-dependent sacrificial sulfur transferase LarE [Methanomicrobium sp.]MDD4126185.1 ATP-dependent sacrificial sulfur transferase LarE [Methanomicrobium sp.]